MSTDSPLDEPAGGGQEFPSLSADTHWVRSLGSELERDRLRRGMAPRPAYLRARAAAAIVVGLALLLGAYALV